MLLPRLFGIATQLEKKRYTSSFQPASMRVSTIPYSRGKGSRSPMCSFVISATSVIFDIYVSLYCLTDSLTLWILGRPRRRGKHGSRSIAFVMILRCRSRSQSIWQVQDERMLYFRRRFPEHRKAMRAEPRPSWNPALSRLPCIASTTTSANGNSPTPGRSRDQTGRMRIASGRTGPAAHRRLIGPDHSFLRRRGDQRASLIEQQAARQSPALLGRGAVGAVE